LRLRLVSRWCCRSSGSCRCRRGSSRVGIGFCFVIFGFLGLGIRVSFRLVILNFLGQSSRICFRLIILNFFGNRIRFRLVILDFLGLDNRIVFSLLNGRFRICFGLCFLGFLS
jgi:hypothetical protein